MAVTYDEATDFGAISIPKDDNPDVIVVRQEVQFQHGPVGENGVNGVQNEDLIELLTIRLRSLNAKFPCRENSIAITKLDEALLWLQRRTAVRVEQGVEGKNEPHTS